MEQEYILRLYDTDLLTFSLSEHGIEGLKAEIHEINQAERSRFPLDMELSDAGLLKWLQRRVIPKNRAYVAEILKTFGLSVNDTKGIIDVCKGLSLNDSFWVVPQGFAGTFAQYNLYENRFSEILSLVAYTGIGQSDAAFTTSPELTTNGMLPKGWRFIEGDGIYLYKGGTSGAANTGNEPYSEFYASQIAQAMGLHAVRYELENWKGILASRCKLFTDIDTAYIPIGRIVREGGLKACLEYYEKLGPETYEEICGLKGIGNYTAGAISAFAYGLPKPAVDGNVLRVVSRLTGSFEDIMKQSVRKKMEDALEQVIPEDAAGDFNQGLIELGAIVCVPNGEPKCRECPVAGFCEAR